MYNITDMINATAWISGWTNLRYSEKKFCERCPEEMDNILDEKGVELFGAVTAHICRTCIREWEMSADVLKLQEERNMAHVRINAFIHAGKPEESALQVQELTKATERIMAFANAWLKEPVKRDGKTRADAIAERDAAEASGVHYGRGGRRLLAKNGAAPMDADVKVEPSGKVVPAQGSDPAIPAGDVPIDGDREGDGT